MVRGRSHQSHIAKGTTHYQSHSPKGIVLEQGGRLGRGWIKKKNNNNLQARLLERTEAKCFVFPDVR